MLLYTVERLKLVTDILGWIGWRQKCTSTIGESVDSLCRDGAELPRAPYMGKACTRLNSEMLSLFRGLTMVLK